MIALEFESIFKKYQNKIVALNNLNLKVKKGRIHGLIGPNGAGKSTCMNILAGLVRSDSGSVKVFEYSIQNNDYLYKKDIGFVLSRPLYFDKLSALEFLSFVGAMYSLKKSDSNRRVEELISYFELDDKKNERIHTYSTGMKKKLSLAAAMLHQPKMLVLDEPFEGIEPQTSKLIRDTLKKLAMEKEITIFISSHNLDKVEKWCNDVSIIHQGQIIFESPMNFLYKNFKKRYTSTNIRNLEDVFMRLFGDERKKQLSWLK